MRRRIGGIAHDVHEGLDQVVAVARDRRQRRIEILDDAQAAAEAGFGDLLHAVEHFVDVDRGARQRHRIAERFHAIDQPADAVGFVADQLGERAVGGRHRFFQKLRRAADARERILDLMRQHRGHAAHRARRAAIQQLAVDALGEAAFLQQKDDRAFGLGRERQRHIGEPLAEARGRQIDIALGDRGAALARLLHELEQRTAEGNQIGELLPQQEPEAHGEELLGGLIGVEQLAVGPTMISGSGRLAAIVPPTNRSGSEKRDTVPFANFLCFTITPPPNHLPT